MSCTDNDSFIYFLISYGSTQIAITDQELIDIGDYQGDINLEIKLQGYGDDSELANAAVLVIWQEPYEECDDLAGNKPMVNFGGLRLKMQEDKETQSAVPIRRSYAYDSAVFVMPTYFANKVMYLLYAGCWTPTTRITIRSSPAVSVNTFFGGAMIYNKVTEYVGNNNEACIEENGQIVCPSSKPPIGKSIYSYDHQPDGFVVDAYGNGIIVDYAYRRGQVLKTRQYRYINSEDEFKIESEKIKSYSESTFNTHYNLNLYQYRREEISGEQSCVTFEALYTNLDHPHTSTWVYMNQDINKEYFYNQSNELIGSKIVSTNYTYDQDNLLPKTIETSHPDYFTKTVQHYDYSEIPGILTDSESYTKDFIGESYRLLSYTEYDYSVVDTLVLLTGTRELRETDTLKNVSIYYDSHYRINRSKNNITEMNTSYFYQDDVIPYPNAKCENCLDAIVENFEVHVDSLLDEQAKSGKYIYSLSSGSLSFTAPENYTIEYWKKANLIDPWVRSTEASWSGGQFTISGSGYIDDVRIYPPGGMITSYTYESGWGIKSISDPNGNSQYFKYDEFGRLIEVYDSQHLIKSFKYKLVTDYSN